MDLNPETQAAFDAVHLALDDKRKELRKLEGKLDQSGVITDLEDIAAQINEIELPSVLVEEKATEGEMKSLKKQKK